MRVLVTGASGLIGSAVCDALLARGDEVVGLTPRPREGAPTNPTVSWYRLAARARSGRRPRRFEGVDGVVNLVGEAINQRWTDEAKRRILESRVTATRNLVAGDRRRPATAPSVLVSQSAVGYYGDRGEAIVDEAAPPGEGFAAEVPVDWEAAAQRGRESCGPRVVILRTGLVLDQATAGCSSSSLLPFKLGLGGPIAGGEQFMPWIHIDDEVGLILWALDNEQVTGVFNATAPEPGHQPRVLQGARAGARPPAAIPVPKFAVRGAARPRAGRRPSRAARGCCPGARSTSATSSSIPSSTRRSSGATYARTGSGS